MNRIRGWMYRKIYRYGFSFSALLLRIQEKRLEFEDRISVVCIAKYEAPYIKEWIDYHLMIGVDRIYVYDNESPDGMKEVLQPYIDSGKVVYTFFPGKARHLDAFNDAISRYKMRTKYMAFIDVDEFLCVENSEDKLADLIDQIMKKNWRSGGVAVNWRVYGSSGHKSMPGGYVIENYLYRGDAKAKGNDCIKTIAIPRYVREYKHTHSPVYITGFNNVNEDGEVLVGWSNPNKETKKLRLNHYFTKSLEEWIERRSRRRSDCADDNNIRTIQEFYQHDHHDIYDPIMLPYAKALREKGLKE